MSFTFILGGGIELKDMIFVDLSNFLLLKSGICFCDPNNKHEKYITHNPHTLT